MTDRSSSFNIQGCRNTVETGTTVLLADRHDRQNRRWLWAIIGIAVLLRIIVALIMGNHIDVLPGINDQVSYNTLAESVLSGQGFTLPTGWWPLTRAGEPTAHWSYLYTFYLTAVYAVFGSHPVIARLIQALIVGILGPWLIYRIGRRVFDSTAGLFGAGLMACYIYFVYYGAALITEAFYVITVLWVLDLAIELAHSPSRGKWIMLGFGLALAILLRQIFLLFVPLLLLWLLWAGRERVRWSHLVLPLVIVGVFILPWTVRNYLAFQRVVLLNTNAGFAFFWANHPIHKDSFVAILPTEGPSYGELIPEELMKLDEASLDSALLQRGIGFVLQDPTRYIILSLSRTKDYFKFWPSPDSGWLSNISRVASFGLSLPFMIYGLILSFPMWRRCSLLYLFIGFYTLIHLLSWALIRYRLPVDAVLIIFAGLALADLTNRLSRSVIPTSRRTSAEHP